MEEEREGNRWGEESKGERGGRGTGGERRGEERKGERGMDSTTHSKCQHVLLVHLRQIINAGGNQSPGHGRHDEGVAGEKDGTYTHRGQRS